MKKLLLTALSYVPTPLPVGLTEFYKWSDSIIAISGKFADEDSMRWAIASQLMHLGAQKAYVPKSYFVRSLRKAAANQVASQVFQDIKTKQAEAAAKLQEATAEGVPSNVEAG